MSYCIIYILLLIFSPVAELYSIVGRPRLLLRTRQDSTNADQCTVAAVRGRLCSIVHRSGLYSLAAIISRLIAFPPPPTAIPPWPLWRECVAQRSTEP